MIDRGDKQWYRDAIIYQIHVKSFFDSDNDGIGDFEGLTQRLDYIRDLGATAIWLMPFYPSPLRDDGYDIADYRGINPSYGTMRDFRRFVREAHERGIRVITELVINHTSDQHPWFQRARKARPGSAARDFYVWSDTDRKYRNTRIIFLDTEKSNWTWDPEAKAYFWHRFYAHQPDLNFDNPRVLEAVINTMYFWLDMGVDGLRLDAIPYLVEREGTSCENLPETHTVIKKIRAALDARYPDRMLLAEANQWPEDTAPYFGDGDECHMSFHFPLMPRMYMALAQEDRHPITDIMRQTPEIPEIAQWAIFLRNHDELTLEMVTAEERDYLWSFYAAERRARINLGIRRRLAPLLEDDRRKIELLNSLLLSMPGTPVLYYGDEIGMGDNIYLGDRDGVRTPMQWSPDRNGGFSRADPQKLFLPAIQDPIYGFATVNVEAQYANPSSLLTWLRRMLAVRRSTQAFGRGGLRFIYPANRKILAYIREYGDDRILCIANVSRAPQAAELDLSEFKGATPVEMTGGVVFPPIGELPYFITLPRYGFYWFKLSAVPVDAVPDGPAPRPELFTLVLQGRASSVLTGRERIAFERNAAPTFLPRQRWFAGKGLTPREVKLQDDALLDGDAAGAGYPLTLARVVHRDRSEASYFLPLAVEPDESESCLPFALARVRRGARVGYLLDAAGVPGFAMAMLDAICAETVLPTRGDGEIRFSTTERLTAVRFNVEAQPYRLGAEQSNTSIVVGEQGVMKLYRRLQPGIHPEVEIGRFLAGVGFANMPALLGAAEHIDSEGQPTALAVLHRFVRNQGDAWRLTIESLTLELEHIALLPADAEPLYGDRFKIYLNYAGILGRRTAEMHLALATPTDDPAFAAEPFGPDDLDAVVGDAREQATRAFASLRGFQAPSEAIGEVIAHTLAQEAAVFGLLDDMARTRAAGIKTRIHGDYHLGQILIVQNDVMVLDFEGEPSRPTAQRRAKGSPLRDVAGMLRSFDYAAEAATRGVGDRFPEGRMRVAEAAGVWRAMAVDAFLDAYMATAQSGEIWISDPAARQGILDLFRLSKALYEVNYEASHRPDWIGTPLRGVLSFVEAEKSPAE